MEKDRQIIFYPAQVQPGWLTKKWALLVYYAWNGLAGALLSGVVIGLVSNIAGGQFPDMLSGLIGALVGGAGFVFAARKIERWVAYEIIALILITHIAATQPWRGSGR